MKTRFAALAAAIVGCLACLPGCGGAYYAMQVNAAAGRVEEAKALGADQLAPYEFYYAKEHLAQAQVEASEASYSDAANYAEIAEEYANKAIQLTEAARRSEGQQ